ncbi:rod shape-determining protein MreD [Lachnospiraceae bacterium 62-35]
MKQRILNLVLILLAFAVQNCIFPQLSFLSASPNLLLILTFSVGFIQGKEAGMFCGLCSGILLDLFYSGPFGFYSLFYIWMGYINGIFTRYYYEDYVTLPLVLSFINDFMYNLYIYIFSFLIRNRLDFFYYFRSIIVPEIIFTVVTTLLIYRIVLIFTKKMAEWAQRRDTTIV